MVKALADHKDRKLSLFKAAKIYGIPESTLRDHLKHMNRTGEATCKKGRPMILTSKEEDEIAMICDVFIRWKFGIGKKEIVQVVRDYCKGNKRSNLFKGGVPRDDWWRGFMRRHPQLVQRRPQALQMVRAESATVGMIHDWFQNCLKPSLESLGLVDKPSSIYNVDESGFLLSGRPGKVIAKRSPDSHWRVWKGKYHSTSLCVWCWSTLTTIYCL